MDGEKENRYGKFKIGLRTIKTAIAVFICLLIHFLLRTETGLYSCIAAVVCMRESVGKSWQMGLHRFLGTLIGGALGYLLVSAAQHTPHYQDGWYVLILPLGMIVCIWLCTLIDKKNGVVVCCVVFIGIGLNPTMDQTMTFYNVVLRVIDTTIGIFVSGLVNRFFFPYYEDGGPTGNGGPEKAQTKDAETAVGAAERRAEIAATDVENETVKDAETLAARDAAADDGAGNQSDQKA